METNNSILNKILEDHPPSKKGIFNKRAIRKMMRSGGACGSLLISLILVVLACCKGSSDIYYSLLNKVVDIALSLFPNLLGFCIGGYALIIGASNISILKKMSKPLGKSNMSYFQILSSVFAMSLIIQCFTLFLSYVIHIVSLMELPAISNTIGVITNVFMLFLILLCSLLSIFLLYYTVVNIFNFGQTTHFSIRLDNHNNVKDE
jgi:hypothetical protein